MLYFNHMSGDKQRGFTIIEVILFLAISGFLVVGILAATGTTISVQRYKDATNSLLSFIQGQYDRTANIQNNQDGFKVCSAGSISTSATKLTPGSSLSCYIVGRLLTVSDDGQKITSRPVYGTGEGSAADDDITSLVNADLFVDTSDTAEIPETYMPEWQTRLNIPKQPTAMDGWQLLIVRSPSTGTIRTFTTMTGDIFTKLTDAASRQDVTACVDPSGLVAPQLQGVVIVEDAYSASGVKIAEKGVC